MRPPRAASGFKQRLLDIVSEESIADSPAILEEYASDLSFVEGEPPELVVYPDKKADVQRIVGLANECRVPLVPVSSRPPRFYGDTVPSRGGVVVDFQRMKQIIKIDPVNRYAMVEPGVTYGELIPEVKKHGLKLCTPLLPRAFKSVVTSRLERQPVLIPKYQYDYLDPLLTLEVVYGTGDDFRTGSASGPGDLDTLKADKVNPWGPGCIDYFRFLSGAQGTMGMVTWASVKTEVLPALQKLFFIPIQENRKIAPPIVRLLRKRVVDECLVLNNVNLATILAENWPEDFSELKKRIAPWTIIICIAGYARRPEERVSIQEKYLKNICSDLGLKTETSLTGAEGKETKVLDLISNPWTCKPYWKLLRKGSCHDIFFLTQMTRVSHFIEIMEGIAKKHGYPAGNMGCYIQPMVQGRGCHCEFNLPFDDHNSGEVSIVKNMVTEASQTLMDNGAFFSRPYGPWAEMVYSRYADGARALEILKDIFDPNHIMNPGKICF